MDRQQQEQPIQPDAPEGSSSHASGENRSAPPPSSSSRPRSVGQGKGRGSVLGKHDRLRDVYREYYEEEEEGVAPPI